jgi:tRNA pseudouridine55 synthase
LSPCAGDATRLTRDFEPLTRCYSGVIRLGLVTSTYDATGDTREELPWEGVTNQDITAAQEAFTGEIQQQVAMWSKTKVQGRPLSWYAERGLAVRNRPTKSVVLEDLQLWREDPSSPTVNFTVTCSKGASMRVLAHDIGKFLGCGAHLAELRRESIGKFSVEKAWMMEVFLPVARKYARGYKFFGPGVQPPQQ